MNAHLEIVFTHPETGERTPVIFTDVDDLEKLIWLRDWVEETSDHIISIVARFKYRMPRPRSVHQAYCAVQAMVRGSGKVAGVVLPHSHHESTFTTARAILLLTCRDLQKSIDEYCRAEDKLRQKVLPTLTQFLEQSQ